MLRANQPPLKAQILRDGPLKIVAANDLGDWGVSMVIYGAGGVGKTTLCAEGAQDSAHGAPVLVADAEGGARAISHRDDIDVATIRNMSDLNTLRDWAMTDNFKYKSIALDNVSEIAAVSLSAIAGSKAPEIQHYGENTRRVIQIIRDFREIAQRRAINVFFILWDAEDKDPGTGIIKHKLALTPALAQVLPGIVDIIGYLSLASDNRTRVLSFAPSNKSVAKFRRNRSEAAQSIPLVIPYNLEDGLMSDILATLRGKEPFPKEKYAARTRATQNA